MKGYWCTKEFLFFNIVLTICLPNFRSAIDKFPGLSFLNEPQPLDEIWQVRIPVEKKGKTLYEYEYEARIKEILEQNKVKGIGIPQLTKIPTLFPDWWRSLNCRKG